MNRGVSIGEYLPDVEAAISDVESRDLVNRIWRKDHTVWNPDPTEIADRLGWLTVAAYLPYELQRRRPYLLYRGLRVAPA